MKKTLCPFSLYVSKYLWLSSLILLFSCAPDEVETEVVPEEVSTSDAATSESHSMGFRPSKESTTINVDISSGIAISPYLFGVNNDWRQVTNGDYPTFEQGLEEINYQVVRFPGGWESEFYDWSENTTPTWRNKPDTPGASIATVKGTNPPGISIVVPTAIAMNEAQWSEEWYAAIQECKREATEAINLTGPNEILSVEIGNEWWLQWGVGVSRYDKVRKYAHIAKRIARHIKTQFPSAPFKLLVNGDYTVPEEFSAIQYVFGDDLQDVDGVALHTYAGYNTDTHNYAQLQQNVAACQENLGKDYLSLSEWMPSRAYNNRRLYAEGANLVVEHIYEHAKTGADEAAFWPPVNNSIPGLGLFNVSFNVQWPTAQLFGDMAASFRGKVLDVTDGTVRGVACQNDNGDVVVYVAGKDVPWTTIDLTINGQKISRVISATLWEPADPSNTQAASPMVKTDNPPCIKKGKSISFNINENSAYTIYKIVCRLK